MSVYFITDGEKVKIGQSRNPQKRLARLQTAQHKQLSIALSITSGDHEHDKSLERYYHDRFSQFRDGGEWFNVVGELADFIKQFPGHSIGVGDVNAVFDGQKTAQERYDEQVVQVSTEQHLHWAKPEVIKYWKATHIEELRMNTILKAIHRILWTIELAMMLLAFAAALAFLAYMLFIGVI